MRLLRRFRHVFLPAGGVGREKEIFSQSKRDRLAGPTRRGARIKKREHRWSGWESAAPTSCLTQASRCEKQNVCPRTIRAASGKKPKACPPTVRGGLYEIKGKIAIKIKPAHRETRAEVARNGGRYERQGKIKSNSKSAAETAALPDKAKASAERRAQNSCALFARSWREAGFLSSKVRFAFVEAEARVT